MATWRKDHLELLFLCQSFNSSTHVGKAAEALNLSLNADSRARISHLVRDKNGLNAQASLVHNRAYRVHVFMSSLMSQFHADETLTLRRMKTAGLRS
jgi:hypothetical protein